MSTEAYPLSWPEGWPRTPAHEQQRGDQFKQLDWDTGSRKRVSFAKARDGLYDELRRLKADHIVISSNFQTDRYGAPIEGRRQPGDQGIAVYFTLKGRSMVMACDRFASAAANMRSLALAIDGMRQLERHGGGTMMERAFAGFEALPGPDTKTHWSAILKVPRDARRYDIESAYKRLAQERHPDKGGSDHQMAELNRARSEALKEAAA